MRSAAHPHTGAGHPMNPEDLYTTSPPWNIGRPQPAFLALAEAGAVRGRVLDVGCGTGGRLTRGELEAAFSDGWRVDSIEPTTIDITTDPDGIRAWLVAVTRL